MSSKPPDARIPQIGTFIGTASQVLIEASAQALDWVVIDLEHGVRSTDIHALIQAADCGGAMSIVRVPDRNSAASVGLALDAGAHGIMFPWIESADDARAAVRQTQHAPAGARGYSTISRSRGYGRDWVPARPDRSVVMVQIESPVAVAAATTIAAVDGVDVLFVGPSDLTLGLQVPSGDSRVALDASVVRVIDAARSQNKSAGLFVADVAAASDWIARGIDFACIGGDIGHVVEATDAMRPLTHRFGASVGPQRP